MSKCRSCLAKSWTFVCLLTVEPALFLASLTRGFYETTTRVLTYDKVCIMLLEDVDKCVARNFTADEELNVHQRASVWEFYRSLCAGLPAVFLIVIYSNLIDRWSKKYTMFLCPGGYIVSSIINLICAVYLSSSPAYMLIGSTVLGLSGGILTLMSACFSYLSATSAPSSLIIHLSFAEATILVSGAISYFASGILLDAVGAAAVYLIGIALNVLLALYIAIRLKNISLASVYALSDNNTTALSQDGSEKTCISASDAENQIISAHTRRCLNVSEQDFDTEHDVQSRSLSVGQPNDSIESAGQVTADLDNNDDDCSFETVTLTTLDGKAPSNEDRDKDSAANAPAFQMIESGSMNTANAKERATEEREMIASNATEFPDSENSVETIIIDENKRFFRKFASIVKISCRLTVVYMRDYVQTAIRRRQHEKRRGIVAILIILMIAMPCNIAVWSGLCYLFVTQEPLSWSTTTYGYLVGVLKGVRGVCLLVVLPILRRLSIAQSVVVVVSLVSSSLSAAVFSVSVYTWMAFLAAVLNIFETSLVVTSRSLIVSFVEEDEHGKAFGMVASLESMAYILSGAIFNLGIYPATVHIFSGLAILVAAILLLVPLLISVWLHFFTRNASRLLATTANSIVN